MGDRGNIVVMEGWDGAYNPPVYLYTHWSGSRLGEVVQRALARKLRWTDGPYLARIIFDELTDGDAGGETGYGISSTICDNEHPYLVVDVIGQRVVILDDAIPATLADRLKAIDVNDGTVVLPFIEHERLAEVWAKADGHHEED